MSFIRRMIAAVLCLLLVTGAAASAFAEDAPYSIPVRIGGGDFFVRAFSDSYDNNVYLSLSDLSAALSGTEKQFLFSFSATPSDGEVFTITRGLPAAVPSGGTEGTQPALSALYTTRNRLFLDSMEQKYYTYRYGNELFMCLTDIQLLFDLCLEAQPDGSLRLYPERSFSPTPQELAASGFFDALGAVLLGDADTGEILYSRYGGVSCPAASLSKLMGYLLAAEAVNGGGYHLTDLVPISENAAALSRSVNGMIKMQAGTTVPLSELLDAMLIASSNESALALAEYLAGSEEAFVAAMNRRTAELGMAGTQFRSCSGLPVYTQSAIPAKRQNTMSASDLFLLCRHLLTYYPALTQRTARQFVSLPSFDYITANSNPMVFNLPGVNGLKTGNTDRAGYCLVSTLPVSRGEETHTLVAIVLGAETAAIRNQASHMLLLYAARQYAQLGFSAVP